MKKAALLAMVLIVMWLCIVGSSSDEEWLSTKPSTKNLDLPSEVVRRNKRKDRPSMSKVVSERNLRAGISIKVIDRATGQLQEDCFLAVEHLGLEFSANDLRQVIFLSESSRRSLIELITRGSDVGFLLVHVEATGKRVEVCHAELKGSVADEILRIEIVVDRYALLLVGVVGSSEELGPWTCRVSYCPPIPPESTARERRRLEIKKRRPQSYRRAFAGKSEMDYDKSLSSDTTQVRLQFLVGRSGEFFVEGQFGERYRGTARIVRLQLGEKKRVTLNVVDIPIVSGILLDVDGVPIPNQRIRIRGKGPLKGGEMFVPRRREGKGSTWDPSMSEIHFHVTTSAVTDANGEFEVPITLTHSVSFEAYVKDRGKLTRTVRVVDSNSHLRGIVLRLQTPGENKRVVRLISPNGEDLTKERVKLIRIDGNAGYYLPIARIDADGWLDTQWLSPRGEYVGRFDSRRYADFFFHCAVGEQVRLQRKEK